MHIEFLNFKIFFFKLSFGRKLYCVYQVEQKELHLFPFHITRKTTQKTEREQ